MIQSLDKFLLEIDKMQNISSINYSAQCHRGYQIGQDLCGCIQKSKGCVTSKKAYLTFLGEEVIGVLFSLGILS